MEITTTDESLLTKLAGFVVIWLTVAVVVGLWALRLAVWIVVAMFAVLFGVLLAFGIMT